jgi:predicted nucleic acid-binding protein
MKKLKLYFDTSVISYLEQQDAPEKMAETLSFWKLIKAGKFDVYISKLTFEELERSIEPKRTLFAKRVSQIDYKFVEITNEIKSIANKFIEANILTQKSFDDCLHIACAIVSGCDVIVSWNFKHIVNYKTHMGVKAVTALEGYKELLIYTPAMLLGYDDDK